MRRSFWLATGALLLGTAGALAWLVRHPAELPEAAIDRARASLLAARSEAGMLAPAELARASMLVRILDRLVAEERAKLIRLQVNERLGEVARELEATADTALDKARTITEERLQAASVRRLELAGRLSELEAAVTALKGDRGIQRAYRRAEIAIDELGEAERQRSLSVLESRLPEAAAAMDAAEEVLGKRFARLHDPANRRRWQRWIDETVAGGRTAILVEKLGHRLVVVDGPRVIASFRAEFGRNGLNDKLASGDAATPEGRYQVTGLKHKSRFYKALPLDYPTAEDLARFKTARKNGQVRARSAGGAIEIHGEGGKGTNWTDGCVALRNPDMDRLFQLVRAGTAVTIVGAARLPGD